jgi:hypothetical protein
MKKGVLGRNFLLRSLQGVFTLHAYTSQMVHGQSREKSFRQTFSYAARAKQEDSLDYHLRKGRPEQLLPSLEFGPKDLKQGETNPSD